MPTNNKPDVLEIDLPDDEPELTGDEIKSPRKNKNAKWLVFDRVTVMMRVFLLLGCLLVAIFSNLEENPFFEIPEFLSRLSVPVLFGLIFAQLTIVAEFFIRSRANIVIRILATALVLFLMDWFSWTYEIVSGFHGFIFFQLIICSASAFVQLMLHWAASAYQPLASSSKIDRRMLISNWTKNPSIVLRLLMATFLLAVLFATASVYRFFEIFPLIAIAWFAALCFLASVAWVAFILFQNFKLPFVVLLISTAVSFLIVTSELVNLGPTNHPLEMLHCLIICLGWLACGGLIKNVAVDQNQPNEPGMD